MIGREGQGPPLQMIEYGQIYVSVSNALREIQAMTKIPVPGKIISEDVTAEYLYFATPGEGAVTYEEGYQIKDHQDEIKIAEWIRRTFGGDVRLLKESTQRGVKMPDYVWRERNWELKTAHSINGADKSLQHAMKQIQDNPGGVILNLLEVVDMPTLERQLLGRFLRSDRKRLDVMILSKNELLKILRYKK